MYQFKDYYHNEVHLSFKKYPFAEKAKHVWVICQYENKWLLTNHSDRGFEFPGGKVEDGESAEEAAIREVKEETGGNIEELTYIGQYRVLGKEKTIIKNIYFAKVKELVVQDDYLETNGPVLLADIPMDVKRDKKFSFIMKDDVLIKSLQKIKSLL
ncbi:RNA deprotection pyrophosphohydrolase [Metabacillus fastidiosus]|uniref:RNA deprotection pyrophosphohydrolase n=1 Tax=Metabacillus fastidiosus TaxID=1458 RepID=UPI003D2D2AEF